jgi:hypothetical protein
MVTTKYDCKEEDYWILDAHFIFVFVKSDMKILFHVFKFIVLFIYALKFN